MNKWIQKAMVSIAKCIYCKLRICKVHNRNSNKGEVQCAII